MMLSSQSYEGMVDLNLLQLSDRTIVTEKGTWHVELHAQGYCCRCLPDGVG
jgi:hypothetical protein